MRKIHASLAGICRPDCLLVFSRPYVDVSGCNLTRFARTSCHSSGIEIHHRGASAHLHTVLLLVQDPKQHRKSVETDCYILSCEWSCPPHSTFKRQQSGKVQQLSSLTVQSRHSRLR